MSKLSKCQKTNEMHISWPLGNEKLADVDLEKLLLSKEATAPL